jgi:ACS family pantothenate transporter-like MFS transporter
MAIGQLPHGIIVQKIAPRIWFPSMVVVWAILTVFGLSLESQMMDAC